MVKDLILKYGLQNAVRFKGKANPGAIVGKILGEKPELKSKTKELMQDINKIIKDINSMKLSEQQAKLKSLAPEMLEKKEKEKRGLQELKNAVEGKVVTRMAPEPSKYNHLGHAISFLLNYLYAKKYKGKCFLRFDDTNPNMSKKEYVDSAKEDLINYLGLKPEKIIFASDYIEEMYKAAEKLITDKNAYVCLCDREQMQDYRHEGKECDCRSREIKENTSLWKDMQKKKYRDGEAVLRLKGDMQADNHVMRDPVIMRVCTEPHYKHKTKYAVWPMYDLESAFMDSKLGITHVLRSNEFGTMREELQNKIIELLNLNKYEIVQYGRTVIKGAETQGRKIRELIEQGLITDWDDPRLVTLRALKRRGFVKEMYYNLVEEIGLSPSQTNIDWTRISTTNRRILDDSAMRYFFIEDPEEIKILNAPEKTVELDLHPDNKKGGRKLKTNDTFFLSRKDFESLKEGKLYRLMDCLNFKLEKGRLIYVSDSIDDFRKKGTKIMHWLPRMEGIVDVEILMPDNEKIAGLAEPGVKKLKVDDVIQFERQCFCRLDNTRKMLFWFTHE